MAGHDRVENPIGYESSTTAGPVRGKSNLAAIALVLAVLSGAALGMAVSRHRFGPVNINDLVSISMFVDSLGIVVAGAGLVFRVEKRPWLGVVAIAVLFSLAVIAPSFMVA
jgi:hypothetical protein